jgi:hypothetical protein
MWLGDHYAATDMGRAGKIAIDGGEAQNAGGLRRVAVEVIVAGNTNVGHHLPPKFGCESMKGCCTWQVQCQQGNQERLSSVRGTEKRRIFLYLAKSLRWECWTRPDVSNLDSRQRVDANSVNHRASRLFRVGEAELNQSPSM